MFHECRNVFLEEGFRVHCSIDYGRRDRPVVRSDSCRPVGDSGSVFRHARSGVGPYFVYELGVDLEPVRVILFATCERRREAIVHETQGRPVCKPDPVADVVHPFLFHLGVGWIRPVLLHHHQVEVFYIGVVIGKSSVHRRHFADGLVEYERAFAGFVHELVLVFKAIDISYHLSEPGACNLVLEFGSAYFLMLAARCGHQESHGDIQYLFHVTSNLDWPKLHFLVSADSNRIHPAQLCSTMRQGIFQSGSCPACAILQPQVRVNVPDRCFRE